MRLILASALFCAVALPAAAGAGAWQADSRDHARLDSLSPYMREHVMTRMGPEQRLPELVETTILNELAQDYDGVRNLHRSGNGFAAEVLTAEGRWKTVTVDMTTGDITG